MPTLPTPLSPADRVALGLAARKQLARSAHAGLHLKASHSESQHDPLALLRPSEADRIQPLVAVKHQLMAASAFGFYRGAVPVMAADLALQPNTGLVTQLCGDAHISNLGAFETPDGNLTFDINDFDESIRGPFEYDVKRLATSLILGGREAGIKRPARQKAVLHFLAQYRQKMHEFAGMPVLELARHQIHRLAKTPPMPDIFAQAQRSTPAKTLNSLTTVMKAGVAHSSAASSRMSGEQRSGEQRIFKTDDCTPHRLRRVTGAEAANVLASLGPYSRTLQPERRHFLDQYRPVDVGFKVVGTGSVGLHDYIVYLEGTHTTPKKGGSADPLFLQIKEEQPSAYAPYLPEGSQHTHNGHRVMDGQRAMQLTSDPFLGYTTIAGRDYLVRQLNDHKASLDIATLTPQSLLGYADLCGELFARGHARSGDPVAIAAYLGNSNRFDKAILDFAHHYADQTEAYWAAFKKEIAATSAKSRPAPPKKNSAPPKKQSRPRHSGKA
jgi:uncharacterized protein (DUF2252 family)